MQTRDCHGNAAADSATVKPLEPRVEDHRIGMPVFATSPTRLSQDGLQMGSATIRLLAPASAENTSRLVGRLHAFDGPQVLLFSNTAELHCRQSIMPGFLATLGEKRGSVKETRGAAGKRRK